jgi:lipoprotein NlpI
VFTKRQIVAISLLGFFLSPGAVSAAKQKSAGAKPTQLLDDDMRTRIESEHPKWSLDQVNAAIKANPKDAGLLVDRATIYYLDGDIEPCIASCNLALSINPQCARAYVVRGRLYAGIHQWDKAFHDYNVASKVGDPIVATDALSRSAYLHRESKQYELARAQYDQVLKSAVLSPALRAFLTFQRGEVYHRMGKVKEAFADYSAAIKIDPEPANYYLFRGRIYRDQGDLKNALADFTTAVNHDLKARSVTAGKYLGECYLERARLYDALGKPDLAKKDRLYSAKESQEMFDAIPFRAH